MAKSDTIIRTPKQQRGIETRERIVMAALELFAKQGFHRTNSKQIAARAGVAVGSFYAYFQDKKDLFKSALQEYDRRIGDGIDLRRPDPLDKRDPKQILDAYIQQILRAHMYYPDFHREALLMRQEDVDVKKLMDMQERNVTASVLQLFLEWRDHLRVKDLNAAAFLVQNAIESTVHGIAFAQTKLNRKSLLKELTVMISRYLFFLEDDSQQH